jgi:hypothetical protein
MSAQRLPSASRFAGLLMPNFFLSCGCLSSELARQYELELRRVKAARRQRSNSYAVLALITSELFV